MATDLQAVRRAAEEIIEDHGCRAITPWATVRLAADYILATITESPELPIAAGWLREEWGMELSGTGCYETKVLRIWLTEPSGFSCHGNGPVELNINGNIHRISTRHQFMQLAAALGIQRKRKDGV